jgi:hypothetical protein
MIRKNKMLEHMTSGMIMKIKMLEKRQNQARCGTLMFKHCF